MRRVHCVLPGQPMCLNIVGKARNCLFVTQTSLNWIHPVWVGSLPPPRGFLILPEFLPGFSFCAVTGQPAGRSSWKWLPVNPGLFLGRRHLRHSRELKARSWCEFSSLSIRLSILVPCFNWNFLSSAFWYLRLEKQLQPYHCLGISRHGLHLVIQNLTKMLFY